METTNSQNLVCRQEINNKLQNNTIRTKHKIFLLYNCEGGCPITFTAFVWANALPSLTINQFLVTHSQNEL